MKTQNYTQATVYNTIGRLGFIDIVKIESTQSKLSATIKKLGAYVNGNRKYGDFENYHIFLLHNVHTQTTFTLKVDIGIANLFQEEYKYDYVNSYSNHLAILKGHYVTINKISDNIIQIIFSTN